MSIAEWKPDSAATRPGDSGVGSDSAVRPLHRIKQVRCQQGMSLRSAARRTQMDVSEIRRLEKETSDVTLSTLYRFQRALEVPVASLLVDQDDPLSEPVQRRAQLVRVMKTAAALQEKAEDAPIQRLATMLIEQLIEIMPELKDVSPWHTVGQRRSLDEYGRIAEQPVSDDWFFNPGG